MLYFLSNLPSTPAEHTQLNGLTQRDLQEVCAGLSVDLPLPIALSLPLDDLYWRRRTQAHFPPPHVSLQGKLNNRAKSSLARPVDVIFHVSTLYMISFESEDR